MGICWLHETMNRTKDVCDLYSNWELYEKLKQKSRDFIKSRGSHQSSEAKYMLSDPCDMPVILDLTADYVDEILNYKREKSFNDMIVGKKSLIYNNWQDKELAMVKLFYEAG